MTRISYSTIVLTHFKTLSWIYSWNSPVNKQDNFKLIKIFRWRSTYIKDRIVTLWNRGIIRTIILIYHMLPIHSYMCIVITLLVFLMIKRILSWCKLSFVSKIQFVKLVYFFLKLINMPRTIAFCQCPDDFSRFLLYRCLRQTILNCLYRN